MKALAAALLVAVAAWALYLREASAPAYAGDVAGGGVGVEWAIDDPDAAYHLRRVSCALAAGEVPARDRFLAHPDGSPVPWPPLLDATLAGIARAVLARPLGDPELGGVEEADLEALLVHAPPVIGVLATLLVALAAALLCERGGTSRAWAALVAASVYAGTPIAIWYGGVTRIDHHVLVAALLALHLALVTVAARGEELVDVAVGALLAGVVAGLALLTWLASAVFVGLGAVPLALVALSRDGTRARYGARAGALYFVAAAAVVLVPAGRSPWNDVQPGSLVNLTEGVPRALGAAALCFFLLGLPELARRGPALRAAVLVAALWIAALLLPGFRDGLREGRDWVSRGNLFMDQVAESRPLLGSGGTDVLAALQDLGPVVLLVPLGLVLLLPGWRRPWRVHLFLLGAVLLAMTLAQRRFGNSLAVPAACTAGVLAHDLLRRTTARGARRAAATAVALLALLGLSWGAGANRSSRAELSDLARWRAGLVDGLRWMRTNTPPSGPWNAAEASQSYGVLSAWGLGHLIEYHARRPSIATNFGSFVGEDGFAGSAEALLRIDPEMFVRDLERLDATYVAVTPRQVGDLLSLARCAGWPAHRRQALLDRRGGTPVLSEGARLTALWRLALFPPGTPADHYPGLVRVWSSPLRESVRGTPPARGEPSGPILSIYRRVDPADTGEVLLVPAEEDSR